MKYFTRLSKLNPAVLLAFLFITSVSLTACSSSRHDDFSYKNYLNDGKRKFVFHDDGVKWKVYFEEGDIKRIYKDGDRIPDNEIAKYEDYIYDKVEETDEAMKEFHANMEEFRINMEEFKHDMEKMKTHNFNIHFDGEEFGRKMQNLASELRITFDSDDFQDDMARLREDLKDIRVDVDIDMDQIHEEVQRSMAEIDMSDFKRDMAELKSELKKSKGELKAAKKGVRKFNRFMNDLSEELEKDGIIKDADEDFDMEFNSREMIIDGEKVPDELHKKYKQMYEDRLDRKMDDDMSIKTNEW